MASSLQLWKKLLPLPRSVLVSRTIQGSAFSSGSVSPVVTEDELKAQFEKWCYDYGRTFCPPERERVFQRFKNASPRKPNGRSLNIQRTDDEVKAMFEEWMIHYGKSYENREAKEEAFQRYRGHLRQFDRLNDDPSCTRPLLDRYSDLRATGHLQYVAHPKEELTTRSEG